MYKVRKRTGKLIEFDLAKISNAITLAFDACEKQYNQNIIDFLALKVTANFEPKIKNGAIAVARTFRTALSRCSFRRITPRSQRRTYCTAVSMGEASLGQEHAARL